MIPIKEIKPEHNTFSNIVVDITHRCNMECANCYLPNREIPDMDKNKLYEFMQKLPSRTYIRLVGAEPTMRDDLTEIIKSILSYGHKPSVTTNGLKLANFEYTKSLKDAGLSLVLISMNGADDDEVYKVLDNGKWSTVKVRALENVMQLNMIFNTGSIIAKGVNEKTVKDQVNVVVDTAKKLGINFDSSKVYRRVKPIIRLKSVGNIGRNIGEDTAYSMTELVKVVANQLNITEEYILGYPAVSGVNRQSLDKNDEDKNHESGYMFPYKTEQGELLIRLIDWQVDDEGMVDPGNPNRGRITQDWNIASFFDHVKANEFGY